MLTCTMIIIGLRQPDEDNSAILIMMAVTITEVGAGLRIDHKALRKMFPVGCLP